MGKEDHVAGRRRLVEEAALQLLTDVEDSGCRWKCSRNPETVVEAG